MVGQSNGKAIPRDIVEDRIYAQQADEIDPARKQLDEALLGVFFTIARLPEFYYQDMQGPSGAPICVVDRVGIPSYRIWFTYTDQQVLLLGIVRRFNG